MRKGSYRFLSFLGWADLFEDSQRRRPVHDESGRVGLLSGSAKKDGPGFTSFKAL
jgi:hypothetical protein